MTDAILLCYCACPDANTATRIAETLVDERLAACVNQLSGVTSTYRWEGRIVTDDEVLLLIKTTEGRLSALRKRVLEMHPYELPELIAVPVVSGHPPYLDWVRSAG